jgi:hypothetical protein
MRASVSAAMVTLAHQHGSFLPAAIAQRLGRPHSWHRDESVAIDAVEDFGVASGMVPMFFASTGPGAAGSELVSNGAHVQRSGALADAARTKPKS